MINNTWFKSQPLPGDELYNDYIVIYLRDDKMYGRTVKSVASSNDAVKKLQEHYKKVGQKIKICDKFFKESWNDNRSLLDVDWIDDIYAHL
jgi:hypothetical protein